MISKKFFLHVLLSGIILFKGCESFENLSPDVVLLDESATPSHNTKNVIIIVIDGPRFSETWGDPTHALIPNLTNNLGPLGNHYSWFYNQGPSITSAGLTALTTGRYQRMKNDGSELPKSPSIFQLYLNQTRKDPRSAQIITSKAKLSILADCTDGNWRGRFNPLVNAEDREDSVTYKLAINSLIQDQPNLMLIHFRGPDAGGHAGDWTAYLNSIIETDEYVWDLWLFLQGHEIYKNNTALFVTNDHGRHLDHIKEGFVSHGDNCEGCRHISLFAIGPDFHKGNTPNDRRELTDIAPTIAELLGFQMPHSEGKILSELFINN